MPYIKNLHVSVGDKPILKGINLEIKAGEIHAIVSPNGSGKSTLSDILSGKSDYTVTGGSVTYQTPQEAVVGILNEYVQTNKPPNALFDKAYLDVDVGKIKQWTQHNF